MPKDYEHLGLSDEELEAMNAPVEDDDAPEDEPETDEPEVEPEADEAPAPVVEPEPEPEVEPEPEPTEPPEFRPEWKPAPVEGFEAKMAELDAQKKALRDQYRDGDLDLDAYEDQRDKVESQILEMREAKLKTDIAEEQSQQALSQRWNWEIERFLESKDNALFRADAPNSRNADLDMAVRMLGNDPKHSDKPMRWFLEEAARWVNARYGDAPKPAAPTGKRGAPIPPSIASLPAADLNDVDGDEFANIDKLSGMEIERAIAKMSEADRERYLRSN